jgi:hypothetical protein
LGLKKNDGPKLRIDQSSRDLIRLHSDILAIIQLVPKVQKIVGQFCRLTIAHACKMPRLVSYHIYDRATRNQNESTDLYHVAPSPAVALISLEHETQVESVTPSHDPELVEEIRDVVKAAGVVSTSPVAFEMELPCSVTAGMLLS